MKVHGHKTRKRVWPTTHAMPHLPYVHLPFKLPMVRGRVGGGVGALRYRVLSAIFGVR